MDRSENMRRIKNKDTKPEMIVRRLIHGMGFRYRLHNKNLPGKPDLTFNKKKKVILMHGCFWHRHKGCKNARRPKTNIHYWDKKFKVTKIRDSENQAKLKNLGWDYLIIWECQLRDLESTKKLVKQFLENEQTQ